jgi:hypothetical protein
MLGYHHARGISGRDPRLAVDGPPLDRMATRRPDQSRPPTAPSPILPRTGFQTPSTSTEDSHPEKWVDVPPLVIRLRLMMDTHDSLGYCERDKLFFRP